MLKALVRPTSGSGDFTLDSETLDQVKAGMRTAGIWPPFVSIGEGTSASPLRSGIELSNSRNRGRTFPSALGFTYMVCQGHVSWVVG